MAAMEEGGPEDGAATQVPFGMDGNTDPMSESAQGSEDKHSIDWSDLKN